MSDMSVKFDTTVMPKHKLPVDDTSDAATDRRLAPSDTAAS